MENEMENFYNIKISDSLHQKVKDIMQRDMTKVEVHTLIHWRCDVWAEDDYKVNQLVSLKRENIIH